MTSKIFISAVLVVALLLATGSRPAWAGSTIKLDNEGRNNVSVRFITIKPNSTLPGKAVVEVVVVNANSVISCNLQESCISEIYVKDKLRMSFKGITGLGCFNLTGSSYSLIIKPDESVKLQ